MLSQKPWKGEAVLLLVCALFVAIALSGLAVGLVEKFGTDMTAGKRQMVETVVQTFSFQGLGLILVIVFLAWQRIGWNEAFGLKSSTPKRVVLFGVIAGLAVLPIAWFLQEVSISFLTRFEMDAAPQEIIQRLQSTDETGPHKFYLFFTAVIGAPIIEEIFFRGIFYPTIKQFGLPRIAFWGTAVLFAASHFNKQTFLPLTFFAVILTMLYEETDNLLTPMIAHATFNAANFLLLVFKDPLTDLLNRFV